MLEPEGFSVALRFLAARPGEACRQETPLKAAK